MLTFPPQMTSPLLGTAYILSQSPTSPPSAVHQTTITPSLCANLSAFKTLLRQSRSLDDSIILRLNRAAALARANPARGECDAFWLELVERWSERGQVLGFCEGVVEERARTEREQLAGREKVERGLDRDKVVEQRLGRGESEGDLKVSLLLVLEQPRTDLRSDLQRRMIQNEIRGARLASSAATCAAPAHRELLYSRGSDPRPLAVVLPVALPLARPDAATTAAADRARRRVRPAQSVRGLAWPPLLPPHLQKPHRHSFATNSRARSLSRRRVRQTRDARADSSRRLAGRDAPPLADRRSSPALSQ